MRTPIVIEDGNKRFQYMVSYWEENGYVVENPFGLLDIYETSEIVGQNTYIISDTLMPIVKNLNFWRNEIFGQYQEMIHIDGDDHEIGYYEDNLDQLYYYDDNNDLQPILADDNYLYTTVSSEQEFMQAYYYDSNNNLQPLSYRTEGYDIPFSLPEYIHKMVVRVDIPDFNPSVYTNSEYIVDISTRIGLSKVVLACKRFTVQDILSIEKPYTDGSNKYNQCFTIEILDPWELCYSDEYAQFRQLICEEIPGTNTCGAILDIGISVVTYGVDEYIPDSRYAAGRNLLQLSERDSDYMSLVLSDDADGWLSKVIFNDEYGGVDFEGYLEETYFIQNASSIAMSIAIMDDENIYKFKEFYTDLFNAGQSSRWIYDTKELRFDDWSEYIDGMYAVVMYRILDSENNDIMDLKSNKIPITKRKFSFLVGDYLNIPRQLINMTVINIDAVNKISKNVVVMNRPDDYKSNIVKPVFYRSFPLEKIEIHGSVTFTISIDLDSYKNKSDGFTIQIEGKRFPEVGRVAGGVLFKINGTELPQEEPFGKYYILDKNQELVAEGNYEYA